MFNIIRSLKFTQTLRYSLKYVKNIPSCGFPKATIARVQSELEKGKINYMLLDPRNNYDVDYKFDFKNDNKYDEKFEKSYKKNFFKIGI